MTAASLPPKLSLRLVPATIAGPLSRNAIAAAPMISGRLP
jgi:hypothetical protein